MKKNVGNTDRILRLIAAIVFIALFMSGVITGTLGWVLMIAAVIFAATSIISFCPIYAILGISSCPAPKK